MDLTKDLTKRQQEIFEFIKRYSASYGYPPTVRDIGKAVGLASSSTVHATPSVGCLATCSRDSRTGPWSCRSRPGGSRPSPASPCPG